jgi:apolipoprotein N-acyltransferase
MGVVVRRTSFAVSVTTAALTGGAYAWTLPPAPLGGAAWVVLVPLLLVLSAEPRPVRAAAIAAAFAIPALGGSLGWAGFAVADMYQLSRLGAALVDVVVVALPALDIAAFGALTVLLLQGGVPLVVAAPASWVTAELLWSDVVPAVPWSHLGHTQHATLVTQQLAELAGVPGISFVIMVTNAALADAAMSWRVDRRRATAMALTALGTVTLVLLWGTLRLGGLAPTSEAAPVRVGLVQAAIAHAERWRPAYANRNLQVQVALTRDAVAERARLVVWSETALDFLPDRAPQLGRVVARALGGDAPVYLLAGMPRRVRSAGGDRFFNSAVLLDPTGTPQATYDKIRLVPLHEYDLAWIDRVPLLARVMAPLRPRFIYEAGRAQAPIVTPWGPFGVFICYEAAFPDLVRSAVAQGARVLVNLSNDAVLGSRRAALQHFAHARMRAVEVRRPLIRVANGGIGAVVTASGRVAPVVAPEQAAVVVADVTPARGLTPFVRGGWCFPYLVGAATLVAVLWTRAAIRDRG